MKTWEEIEADVAAGRGGDITYNELQHALQQRTATSEQLKKFHEWFHARVVAEYESGGLKWPYSKP